jgi:hypothetical protein
MATGGITTPIITVIAMNTMMRWRFTGSATTHSEAIMGIFVTARKWPSTVEPAMSIRTMQAVRRASDRDLMKPRRLRPRWATDRRITAKVPTLPASVGVKKPFMSPPTISTNTSRTHASSGREARRCLQLDFAPLGPRAGLAAHQR